LKRNQLENARREREQRRTDEESERWLHETVLRLKTALISYELQAQVLGQRLTPNAALVRLIGTDRLTVNGIEAKRSEILTTHALKLINVSALPGEILIHSANGFHSPMSGREGDSTTFPM
jgi:S-DNA-T family DNA segregation ATPase FtsK/SpoIIIE